MRESDDWSRIRDSVQALRVQLARGEVVERDALGLLEDLRQASRDVASIPAAPARSLARKAALLRERLVVGEVPLPEGSGPELVGLAAAYSGRVLGRRTVDDFEVDLDRCLSCAQEANERANTLEQQRCVAQARVDLLAGYLALLEAASAG